MSYVRVGIIWKHRFHVVDVHGGHLRIDVLKDIDSRSGIVADRINRGFPTIKSDRDKELFLRYLQGFHIEGEADADYAGPYEYNSIIDLDNNVFYSMKGNWFDCYSKYLPENWQYIEVGVEEMRSIKDGINFID